MPSSTTIPDTKTAAEQPKEAVLLLSTLQPSNVPMVIDFKGKKLTINKCTLVTLLFLQETLMLIPFLHMEMTLKFLLPVRQRFITSFG